MYSVRERAHFSIHSDFHKFMTENKHPSSARPRLIRSKYSLQMQDARQTTTLTWHHSQSGLAQLQTQSFDKTKTIPRQSCLEDLVNIVALLRALCDDANI